MYCQCFRLPRLQADDDFTFERAENEIGLGKARVGVGDGCGVGPVAVVEKSAVVDVTFEDDEIGTGDVVAQRGWQFPEGETACPEWIGDEG